MMNSVLESTIADCHPASVPDYTPAAELRDLQLKRMQAIVARAWQQVKLFRARMDERGLTPDDIRSLSDVAKLPLTVKNDLRDTYPDGLFASPMKDVVRLHASSGTTGKPIVVGYTKEDIDVWTSVLVRCLAGCGLHRGDIIQVAYGYGLFTGGLGAHYGAEALGAAVIPEPLGGAHRNHHLMASRLKIYLRNTIRELAGKPIDRLLDEHPPVQLRDRRKSRQKPVAALVGKLDGSVAALLGGERGGAYFGRCLIA